MMLQQYQVWTTRDLVEYGGSERLTTSSLLGSS
jgi:hypothetical protein